MVCQDAGDHTRDSSGEKTRWRKSSVAKKPDGETTVAKWVVAKLRRRNEMYQGRTHHPLHEQRWKASRSGDNRACWRRGAVVPSSHVAVSSTVSLADIGDLRAVSNFDSALELGEFAGGEHYGGNSKRDLFLLATIAARLSTFTLGQKPKLLTAAGNERTLTSNLKLRGRRRANDCS